MLDNTINLETSRCVYNYSDNMLSEYNKDINSFIKYKVSNNDEYERVLNIIIDECIDIDKWISKEHIEFFKNIKKMIDIKKFAECNYDYVTFALSED